ncbi:barstar family protein [Sphingomonas sp. RT2P30]|uniref:barstar family protein n=1 Tax=Parasphingomonas halimpatiens TaxID=3096162 RepID=UPI002FC94F2B
MKTIELDASTWSSPDDFFSALLPALGSPGWHGYNLNALWDSITSNINDIEPPFSVVVQHANLSSKDIMVLLQGVSAVFADARSERGLDVQFSIR